MKQEYIKLPEEALKYSLEDIQVSAKGKPGIRT